MRITFLFVSIFLAMLLQAQEKRVLFLGNSYTFVNDLPQLTVDCAASVGDLLEFDYNTPGGYTLQAHSTNENSLLLIMQGNWDYMVLQEQSQRPSLPIEQVELNVFPYARFLDSINQAYNNCGETMFYMTWGRKNGDASNCGWWPPVCTYLGMDSLLHLRYMMMADSNHSVVSPVGAVWRYIRQTYPNIELYAADESHPSVAGSYAAACCFYTAIFKKDPMLITFNSTLDTLVAANIRMAAKTIVFDNLLHWHVGEYDVVADFNYLHIDGYTYQFTNLSENANGQVWDFGGITDTTSSPVYTFPGAGIYDVVLTSYNVCDTVESSQLVSVIETGLYEDAAAKKWAVYPNPVDKKLHFRMQNSSEVSVTIYNLAGEKVLSQEQFSGNEIDVSMLDAAVYLIEITRNGVSQTRKMIKK